MGDLSFEDEAEQLISVAETEGHWGPVAERLRTLAKAAQPFFATLAAEARRPHFGDQAKEWTRALLLRAEEAGLYQPETK